MQRREFITLLGGAAVAWPLGARAQQPERLRRIGVLEGYGQSDPEGRARTESFAQGLQKLGWLDGQNVKIEYRFGATDPGRLEKDAAELVGQKPDVIVATTTLIAQTVLKHSRSTPIIFVNVSDPIASGLVVSLARPGGNITGFTNYESSLAGKWIGLLKEVAPRTGKIAVLGNAQNPAGIMFFNSIEAAGASVGVQVSAFGVSGPADIERAMDLIVREADIGLVVLPEPVTRTNRTLIIELAARYHLPAIYPFRFFTASGGLIAYGVDQYELYRRAASYVDRILRGAKTAELPVEQPTKFDLAINLKTAKALGLEIPPQLLTRADEVIE
jgi:putative ABC transport system substrate-binding protein